MRRGRTELRVAILINNILARVVRRIDINIRFFPLIVMIEAVKSEYKGMVELIMIK